MPIALPACRLPEISAAAVNESPFQLMAATPPAISAARAEHDGRQQQDAGQRGQAAKRLDPLTAKVGPAARGHARHRGAHLHAAERQRRVRGGPVALAVQVEHQQRRHARSAR